MVNEKAIQKSLDKAILEFKKANYDETISTLINLKTKKTHFLIYWYLGHAYFRINNYVLAINSISGLIPFETIVPTSDKIVFPRSALFLPKNQL